MLIVQTGQRETIQELQESHDRPRRPRSGCVRLDLSSSANVTEQKLVNKCRNLQSEPGFTCSTRAFVGQAVAVVSPLTPHCATQKRNRCAPRSERSAASRGQRRHRRDSNASLRADTRDARIETRSSCTEPLQSEPPNEVSPLTRCPPKPCIASRHYRQACQP